MVPEEVLLDFAVQLAQTFRALRQKRVQNEKTETRGRSAAVQIWMYIFAVILVLF